MRFLSLFLFLTFSACDYQDGPIVIKQSDFGVLPSQPRNAAPVERNEYEKSFERYLELFVVDNPIETEFDTLVDYQRMYQLSQNPGTQAGQEYADIVSTIQDYFAGLNYESLNTEEKKAHLINAYNFFVMDFMAQNYLTTTNILKFPRNVFQQVPFQFANQLVSLDYLEKFLLYQLMTFESTQETTEVTNLSEVINVPKAQKIDARFHFAVICGAKGCPILNTEMYYGERLDSQLTEITRAGLHLKRNLNQSSGRLQLTQLFEWYRSDFDNHAESSDSPKGSSFYDFLTFYTDSPVLRSAPEVIPYDWERNGTN